MADMSSELAGRITAIRASGLFVAAEYEYLAEAALKRQDPIHHYLTYGEARGGRPSRHFDPEYYRRKHRVQGDSPLIHYLMYGQKLALRTVPAVADFEFVETGFRPGFRRFLFLAPQGRDDATVETAVSLLRALHSTSDPIVLFPNNASVTHAYTEVAACTGLPRPSLQPGWEDDPFEITHLVVEVLDHFKPTSAVCFGSRHNPLVPYLAARFIPIVTVALDDDAPAQDRTRFALYRQSAAILFASEDLRQSHAARYPWIASRRTAAIDLSPSRSTAVARSSEILHAELNRAEELLSGMAKKFRQIESLNLAQKPMWSNVYRSDEFRSRLRENCVTGCLSTGGVPDFPIPRILTGFDARTYAATHGLKGGNPSVHYLASGCPDGFLKPVIGPEPFEPAPSALRAALHGHYHYVDIAHELFEALSVNRHGIDLYLSTDTDTKAQDLSRLSDSFGIPAEIRVFANRGRDIGPLLTGFRDLFYAGYEVIGHVHGKKSLYASTSHGDRWRRHLLEHTLGGVYPMADAIMAAFSRDPKLGLVFPEDDRVLGWERNLEHARRLASRMTIEDSIERSSFDFPAGTYFWCRPSALGPLLSLSLDWSDYPEEPVGKDGSILHALERILPFVCEASGHHFVKTHIPDVKR